MKKNPLRQPGDPTKRNYEIYCLYHNRVTPRFYGSQKDDITFVKMDKGPYVFRAKKHIYLAEMPWFKPIGKGWAEYEFYYSLYKGSQEGLVELPEYVGFIQYDMAFSVDEKSVFDFADQTTRDPHTLLSLQPYNALDIWNQNVLIGTRNCLEVVIEEYNGKYGTVLQIDDLLKGRLDMCGSFILHRSLFAQMMDFLSEVIEDGRLEKVESPDYRMRGGLLERYAAVFLWAQSPHRLELPLQHYFSTASYEFFPVPWGYIKIPRIHGLAKLKRFYRILCGTWPR